ncbi:hypothetical protein PM082_015179 [Marasmius tenuissimus]|nr:hypothetical protein PM082_015179 [Marasmius tenuissimus]
MSINYEGLISSLFYPVVVLRHSLEDLKSVVVVLGGAAMRLHSRETPEMEYERLWGSDSLDVMEARPSSLAGNRDRV